MEEEEDEEAWCSSDSGDDDADIEERKSQNVDALVRGNLIVKRQSLLPRLLSVSQGAAVCRKPFKPPCSKSHASGYNQDLTRRLSARKRFVPWGASSPIPRPALEELKFNVSLAEEVKPSLPPGIEPLVLWHPQDSEDEPSNADLTTIAVDPLLVRYLRPHQREGVQFMFDCVSGLCTTPNIHGCILADDMGLGKTLQSITLLYTLICQGFDGKPMVRKAIIVTPTSLVSNWEAEIKKWVGERLRLVALCESTREDVVSGIDNFTSLQRNLQVLIVSYETFRRHSSKFSSSDSCDLLICDEAHRLKNDQTITNRALAALPCKRRILLSGTPLQNDLEEFFAMVNFTNPGILGDIAHFRRYYEAPIICGREPAATAAEKKLGAERSAELSVKVNRFILRRTNALLSNHLPPKILVTMKRYLQQIQQYFSEGVGADFSRFLIKCTTKGKLQVIQYEIESVFLKAFGEHISPLMICINELNVEHAFLHVVSDEMMTNFYVLGLGVLDEIFGQIDCTCVVTTTTNHIICSYDLKKIIVEVVCCKLTPLQSDLYKHFIQSKNVKRAITEELKQSKILAYITALKKLCNHPKLIYDTIRSGSPGTTGFEDCIRFFPPEMLSGRSGSWTGGHGAWVELSGKMHVLARLLAHLRQRTNDRIVLVSNYTQTLDLFAQLCRERRYPHLRLDGTTSISKRQKLVNCFNDPSKDEYVFLLSSKAGGCGLNLIGGNRLILFDPDWNPANDKQAAARVWRDGQKKRVYIYRFLSAGTIEEKVFQRQMSKEGLQKVIQQEQTDSLVAQGNFLSTEDLRDLFTFNENIKSEIHEKMRCSRCQTFDVPQSTDAQSTIIDSESDEETSDIGGFAEIAGCLQNLKRSEKQVGSPLEEDLGSWGHHFFPTSVPDAILQASAGDEVTFVFTNQVNGLLVPIESTISPKLQQKEPDKELLRSKLNGKQKPTPFSLHNKLPVPLQSASGVASMSSPTPNAWTKETLNSVGITKNISMNVAFTTEYSLVNSKVLPQKRSCPANINDDNYE